MAVSVRNLASYMLQSLTWLALSLARTILPLLEKLEQDSSRSFQQFVVEKRLLLGLYLDIPQYPGFTK